MPVADRTRTRNGSQSPTSETEIVVGIDESSDDGAELPLSVVVISENESERIACCIESVLSACESAVPAFEVILVDSASTDGTVDIARHYPITLLRIPKEHTISCGAGRFVGDSVARGELVLHVDGDMVLSREWLPAAIEFICSNNGVAAVEGWLNRCPSDDVIDVDKVGGVMLYDSTALEEAGGFDPFLSGYEDVELGYRLTDLGYRLVRLPEVSADHPDRRSVFEPFRRWRSGFYDAPGQALRKHNSSHTISLKLLARQRYRLILLVWYSLGLVTLVSVPLFAFWLLLSVMGVTIICGRLGLRDTIQFVIGNSLGIVGALRGFLNPPRPAEEYPLEAVERIELSTPVKSVTR